MTEQEIIDGNKLIAEFYTGETFFNHSIVIHNIDDEKDLFFDNQLKYHNNWEWLMLVVERIESKGYDVLINGLYCRITDYGLSTLEIESGVVLSKIEAVYSVVVEFIQWFNNRNN